MARHLAGQLTQGMKQMRIRNEREQKMSGLTVFSAAVALAMIGAMAGVFFTFSNSVMPGLDAIKPDQAISAMNGINEKIQNPLFLLTFVGAPLVAGVTGGLLLASGHRAAGIIFLAAAAAYVLGAVMPTMAVNVPMNDKLAAVRIPADMNEAAKIWSDYSGKWTGWNHLRTVGSMVSLLLVGLGLYVWRKNA